MWPDRVSSPGLLTYESGALPTALRGPARYWNVNCITFQRCTLWLFSKYTKDVNTLKRNRNATLFLIENTCGIV